MLHSPSRNGYLHTGSELDEERVFECYFFVWTSLLWVISPGLGGVLGPGRGKGDYRKTNMLQGDNSDKERGKF